jgi:hypothetical protein
MNNRNAVIQSPKWNAIESVPVLDIHSGKRPANAQWNVGIASSVAVNSDQSQLLFSSVSKPLTNIIH